MKEKKKKIGRKGKRRKGNRYKTIVIHVGLWMNGKWKNVSDVSLKS